MHVHVLGICGYATFGAANLAQARGDRVTGSDDHAYPPMSDAVTAAGIEWENRSDPDNLDRWGVPDLVVGAIRHALRTSSWRRCAAAASRA
jgi:UDP-N-acetylmuramate: L-alanyl-gamma-D-glutamyl-meso-diaminopimelate ligase